MNKISPEELKRKAHYFAESGKNWHFHILTPGCILNDSGRYAFILENSTDGEVYFHTSDKILRDLGKELAKLLHGNDIIKDDDSEESYEHEVSLAAKQILDHARELNLQHKIWHHHMLFPLCTFNESKGKWNLILEDPDNDLLLKSPSDEEPKADLKEIETLFYSQDF